MLDEISAKKVHGTDFLRRFFSQLISIFSTFPKNQKGRINNDVRKFLFGRDIHLVIIFIISKDSNLQFKIIHCIC